MSQKNPNIPEDIENVRLVSPGGTTNTARLSGKTAKRSFGNPDNFIGGQYQLVLTRFIGLANRLHALLGCPARCQALR